MLRPHRPPPAQADDSGRFSVGNGSGNVSASGSSVVEGSLIRCNTKTIYLFQDGALHEIPDRDTFVALGFDFGDVKTLSLIEYCSLKQGDPLPSKHQS